MRDAVERQKRERRLAALIFMLLLVLFGLAEGWRMQRPAERAMPRSEHAPASESRPAP
jgi:hypothetical protein